MLVCLTGCGSKHVAPPAPQQTRVATPTKAAQVAHLAQQQIGVRYRYGGDSPRGFDCSGLIWWAYRQYGIKVPRITSDQARFGVGVTPAQARPGDILVFNVKHGLHTGLYLGKAGFVHAPSSGKQVRIDSLQQDSYWRPKLVAIRRVSRN